MSVKLRTRKIREDEYSLYYDEYNKDKRRTYTFTGGKITKDYIKYLELKYATKQDKEVFEEALRELAKRNKELSLNDALEELNAEPLDCNPSAKSGLI